MRINYAKNEAIDFSIQRKRGDDLSAHSFRSCDSAHIQQNARGFWVGAEVFPSFFRDFSRPAKPTAKNREKNEEKPRRPPKNHGFILSERVSFVLFNRKTSHINWVLFADDIKTSHTILVL